MIKASPEDLTKELSEKKEQLNMRISTIEKQEKKIYERIKELKNESEHSASN